MTPCTLHKIKNPIWNGGQRKVGIATYKVGNHNEIVIESTNKDGDRIYPQPFYISGQDLKKYPPKAIPNYQNIKVHEIPIKDLEILERE